MDDRRLADFLHVNSLKFDRQLGFGIHGKVFSVNSPGFPAPVALKIFDDDAPFERELAVFQRLGQLSISRIGKFQVPALLRHDPDRSIILMTLVQRPFCLDFASAYLDELPPWFPPFDEAWHAEKEAQFGADDWPEVLAAVRELESLGILQTDVSPSNIAV